MAKEANTEMWELGRQAGIAQARRLVDADLNDALKAGDGFLAGYLNTFIRKLDLASRSDEAKN